VVNGLMADGPRPDLPVLGVVPGGSANVFARSLGMTNDPVEATAELLDALERGSRRRIGLGLADDRYFCFNAGLGLDADVVRRVEARRAVGRRATTALYVRSGVRQFFVSVERGAPTLLLERDGAQDEQLSLALVCNTTPWTYLDSRPVQACPRADFDSGLDLFGLRRLRTLTTLRHLRQILSKNPQPHGAQVVSLHDLSTFTLSALPAAGPQGLPFQLDGDDLGDRTRVFLSSVPDALDVIV